MTVLRVVVVRTGGFAGLTRTAEVDDPDQAARLSDAVRAAGGPVDDRARDRFVYAFTLVGVGGEHTVDLGESALPPEVRAVVRALFA